MLKLRTHREMVHLSESQCCKYPLNPLWVTSFLMFLHLNKVKLQHYSFQKKLQHSPGQKFTCISL